VPSTFSSQAEHGSRPSLAELVDRHDFLDGCCTLGGNARLPAPCTRDGWGTHLGPSRRARSSPPGAAFGSRAAEPGDTRREDLRHAARDHRIGGNEPRSRDQPLGQRAGSVFAEPRSSADATPSGKLSVQLARCG